jgi:dTDP-4-dehydrorhamnose reductase
MKKIGVFGANGMLGKYVIKYLSSIQDDFGRKTYDVMGFCRSDCDLSQYSDYYKITELIKDCTHIINCAGSIKPVTISQDDSLTFMVNTIFPNYLARDCISGNKVIYHITTDCVFSGNHGNYDESDECDIHDAYGLSKYMGENPHVCNIRTSIIGEETSNHRSLLEWAKSQYGKTIKGYTNHYWNGVTCLQLAKILEFLINYNRKWDGPARHICSDAVSKFELLSLIDYYFNLSLDVIPVEANEFCDRTLQSIYFGVDDMPMPPISRQIKDLYEFHYELFK